MDNSWKTAIARTKPSAPLRWIEKRWQTLNDNEDTLWDHRQEGGIRMLDYGCGRGFDAFYTGADRYDPHWFPLKPEGPYEMIFCTYVLNVVDRKTQWEIIEDIDKLLHPLGTAYVAVRRDIKFFDDPLRDGYIQRYVLSGDMFVRGYKSVYEKKNAFEIFVKSETGDY